MDPRHFITVRQAPLAADPKPARQSLLSLLEVARIHTCMCFHLQHTFTLNECFSHSLYSSHLPLYSHAHNHQGDMMVLDESRLFGRPRAKRESSNKLLAAHYHLLTVKRGLSLSHCLCVRVCLLANICISHGTYFSENIRN